MASPVITPIHDFGGWWAKREDLACLEPGGAGGSKVRVYTAMMERAPGAPLVVGCSATSCQQIYVADAVRRTGREAHVFVPRRKVRSAATDWAAAQGAVIHEVPPPAYRTVYMKAARDFAKGLGSFVAWSRSLAIQDTMAQCRDLPSGVRRVLVPTGSGLVAAAIVAALAGRTDLTVALVCVSGMASLDDVLTMAEVCAPLMVPLPAVEVLSPPTKYEDPMYATAPDGTLLDPYYAAKALSYVRPGDLLWITGCRPVESMPRALVQRPPERV